MGDVVTQHPLPLDKLLTLRGARVKWWSPTKRHGGNRVWAMVLDAESAEEVFPEWVSRDENDFRMVTPDGWKALVVEAVRELEGRVADLEG